MRKTLMNNYTKNFIMAFAIAISLFAFSSNASAQLINELLVNPNGSDSNCEYAEIIGTPNGALTNIFFASIEGDGTSSVGAFDRVVDLSASTLGPNGILVITNDASGDCSRDYSPATRVQVSNFSMENGSNSWALIMSPTTAIVEGTDYDSDNDGTLEALPGDATILDALGGNDGGGSDVTYGAQIPAATGSFGNDMYTRFLGDTNATSASSWYYGDMDGDNTSVMYDATQVSDNFPSGGMLTPGTENVGGASTTSNAENDFDGDGKTDYAIVRNSSNGNLTGGPTPGSSKTWYVFNSGGSEPTVTGLGENGDQIVPADFDGDNKTDIAVWRPVAASGPGGGYFFILNGNDNTVSAVDFGQQGDNPTVVGDYDGDGKADPAVFRPGSAQANSLGGTTFPGTGVGPIPDGQCGTTDLVISFEVSGITGTPSNMDMDITFGPIHTWAGDVDMVLASPDGTEHVIQSFTGGNVPTGFGDSSDLEGPYTFSDTATANWWAAAAAAGAGDAIPSGSYRTQAAGPDATDDPGPAFTSIMDAFTNIPDWNGTWTLTVGDCANQDPGEVSAANLIISSGSGATGGPTTFFYLGSAGGGETTYVPWGDDSSGAIRPYPGDFDGDDKNDFCVYRKDPNSDQGQFAILRSSDFGVEYVNWGNPTTDGLVPGDYDGDNQTDFMNVREAGNGQLQWYLLERDGGGTGASPINWGSTAVAGTTEFITPGDFDGDGSTDVAIYRRDNADDSNCYFYVLRSSDGMLQTFEWGAPGDMPVAGWNSQLTASE